MLCRKIVNRDDTSAPGGGGAPGVQEPEPLHNHRFGLAELPTRVAGFAAKHVAVRDLERRT